jgi:hypothetical protein
MTSLKAAREFPGVSRSTLRLWFVRHGVKPEEDGGGKDKKLVPVAIARQFPAWGNPRRR